MIATTAVSTFVPNAPNDAPHHRTNRHSQNDVCNEVHELVRKVRKV
jgi:hypothetical protein